MPAHQRVRAWIAQHYQRPQIDQEWLGDCSDWIAAEFRLDPDSHFDQFIQHVEAQLLQSNLADSTVPGSGIDPRLVASNQARPRASVTQRPGLPPRQKKTTGPTPLLVEIKGITEIAHSAFSLLNTHQARLDRADLGLAQEENAEQQDEDEGPVPKFSRGMLRFELSDGSTTFRAIEFRSLPQLELGTTPLGYKMFLNSTPIRNGIAFLEPSNVILRGYRTEDHDINREQVFLSSLRKRLGRPDPPPEAPVPQANLPALPAQPTRRPSPVAQARAPSPPTDTDDMFDVDPDVLREMTIQMDEIDMRGDRRALQPAGPPMASTERRDPRQMLPTKSDVTSSTSRQPSTLTAKTSAYFSVRSSKSGAIPDIGLSPRPIPPPSPEPGFGITWETDAPEPSQARVKQFGNTPARPGLVKPIAPSEERSPSLDPFDDLSFDMDVDESYLEHLDMIEQKALGAGAVDKGKGKGKDTGAQGTTPCSRPNAASVKKTPSGSILGMERLATYSAFPSGAEPSMRMTSDANRASSASSLSGSTESPMPQSTQSSERRIARDPSLIIISSSDDEVPSKLLDLSRRHAKKARPGVQDTDMDPDVIDLSD